MEEKEFWIGTIITTLYLGFLTFIAMLFLSCSKIIILSLWRFAKWLTAKK